MERNIRCNSLPESALFKSRHHWSPVNWGSDKHTWRLGGSSDEGFLQTLAPRHDGESQRYGSLWRMQLILQVFYWLLDRGAQEVQGLIGFNE